MKNRPCIGITMSFDDSEGIYKNHQRYASSVLEAGGMPVLLPYLLEDKEVKALADQLDGLLLSGGGDIHPWYFKEECLDGFEMENKICPERDQFEISLFLEIIRQKKPVLGICRGIQLMAIAMGGTIYQDIDACMERALRIRHSQKARASCPIHRVQIKKGSELYRICEEKNYIEVNSFHHQAVAIVPEKAVVTAIAEDGVIEAIEMKGESFCIGVQWHPERLTESKEEARRLFQRFIKEAKA